MSTDTKTLPKDDTDTTEADGKAHYVKIKSLIDGGPVVALCGKKYVPTVIAGAEDRPICPTCKEMHHLLEMMG